MRVVSHKKLKDFYETKGCEDSRVALERWYDIAEKAEWKNLSDIKVDFPAPVVPITYTNSPGSIVRFTSLSALTPVL
mgnify:CR=1 FL=1